MSMSTMAVQRRSSRTAAHKAAQKIQQDAEHGDSSDSDSSDSDSSSSGGDSV